MRPRHWGLSERLLALSLVATLACGTAASWLLREQLHDAVLRSFKAGLQDRAERLQAELQSPGPLSGQGTRLNRGEFGRIFSGWYWTLEQDGLLQQSRSVWDDSLELDDARPWPRHKGSETLLSLRGPQGRELLGLRRSFDVAGRRVQLHVFGPLDGTRQEWRRIDRILLVTELGLVAALLLCTVALVRLGLQPLRSLQQALQDMEDGTRTQLGRHFGPDLDPIAEAVDQVLQRNAQVVERARHQAADLSHALKKPLAVLGIQARGHQVDGPWLRDQVQAMSHTIDRHLARFASGAGSAGSVALDEVLARLLDAMRQIHAQRRLSWSIQTSTPLPGHGLRWRGAASDLEEMAGNLLDNAGKWARSRVTLAVCQDGTTTLLQIDDDGPGLAPEHLAQAMERGVRFDEQAQGHGLGLAIVRDIAETYGGSLEMGPSPLGGLRCTLRLG
jgi:signal transduction histidine kinase